MVKEKEKFIITYKPNRESTLRYVGEDFEKFKQLYSFIVSVVENRKIEKPKQPEPESKPRVQSIEEDVKQVMKRLQQRNRFKVSQEQSKATGKKKTSSNTVKQEDDPEKEKHYSRLTEDLVPIMQGNKLSFAQVAGRFLGEDLDTDNPEYVRFIKDFNYLHKRGFIGREKVNGKTVYFLEGDDI